MDNSKTLTSIIPLGDGPGFDINAELAKKMGWIIYREKYKDYQLGPNIQQEFN